MSTPIPSAASVGTLPRLPAMIGDALRALRAVAQCVAAWREANKRAADDRDTLAQMSDRDLLDIGITRASVDAVADRQWMRDYPH